MSSDQIFEKFERQHSELMQTISEIRSTVSKNEARVESLEKRFETEFSSLKKVNQELRRENNDREQYARLPSIRIDHLIVDPNLVATDGVDLACMKTAYQKIINPVLSAAVRNQATHAGSKKTKFRPVLDSVPDMLSLLSNGHFLKSRIQPHKQSTPTIIIRFRSRFYRNLFLKLRRENLPKPKMSEVTRTNKSFYFVRPDLTQANFKFIQSLKTDERVESAWSHDCKIRFTLASNNRNGSRTVHEAADVFMPVDQVIQEAMRNEVQDNKNVEKRQNNRDTEKGKQNSSNEGKKVKDSRDVEKKEQASRDVEKEEQASRDVEKEKQVSRDVEKEEKGSRDVEKEDQDCRDVEKVEKVSRDVEKEQQNSRDVEKEEQDSSDEDTVKQDTSSGFVTPLYKRKTRTYTSEQGKLPTDDDLRSIRFQDKNFEITS